MSRSLPKSFRLVAQILNSRPKLFVCAAQRYAIIKLPHNFIPSACFSTEKNSNEAKSPLASVLSKDKIGEANNPSTNEEAELKKQRESSWRTMKLTLLVFGVSFVAIGMYLVITLGGPSSDPEAALLNSDLSHKPIWQQYIIRTYRELDFYTKLIQEPSRHKLLPDPLEYPYIQPKYTLVLEITDVLVHPDWTYYTGWRFKKRPGLDYFLETLHGSYEIVVYTAEQGMTLFPLCEAIDPKNLIAYKLPRDTTYFTGGHHVKSLDKLNRDLSKVIAIDWNANNLKLHPENLLHIKQWKGNDDDQSLIDLTAFLKSIADNDIEDVREVLEHYRTFEDPIEAFKEKRQRLLDQLEAEAASKRDQEISQLKRWTPNIFSRAF